MRADHPIVTKIIKAYDYDHGCTCPVLVQLDDGRQAVLKYPKNPQGIIVLFNEYITYQIAAQIGITCPNFGVAVVNETTAFEGMDTRKYSGIGFFSEYIPAAFPASQRTLRHVENLTEACRIVLLDQIVKNTDRHTENLIIAANTNPARLFVIDHSHALGDPDWDQKTLSNNDLQSPYVWRENLDLYNMFIYAGADISKEKLIEESAFIQSILSEKCLKDTLCNVPVEWIQEIGQEKAQHATQYILNRINNLDVICKMICTERGV